ncbi:HAD family hydrolase [Amycolatopsis azurea]|uniref:Cof family hydrolase n=1 Tax=Amycolatopsis azurea DSM 43854 TaxID=1238180 RepID=M2QDL5_9PSEU|nr:HAD family hydrolase [Amycolatopsis azurea]EMD30105.1 Cof family hydrolase [Amycolatopsis azurea DSM 43854]
MPTRTRGKVLVQTDASPDGRIFGDNVPVDKPLLIASDVDGTLLGPMEVLTERTIGAVRRVTEDGVPFVLVSGRPPRWIAPIANPLDLTGYAVCANGAVLYEIGTDRIVAVHGLLEPTLLHDAVSALDHALPGCRYATERIGESAADEEMRNFVIEPDYHNPWGDNEGTQAPRAEVLGHPAIKLMISRRGMTSDEMARAAREVLEGAVDITYSTNSGLIEVSAHGVTKATGLAEVAERLGVPAERVIAFGDMPNDIEMLGWAGHGVAMANAHRDVLDVADEVTAPNSEDGVAQVLERWF